MSVLTSRPAHLLVATVPVLVAAGAVTGAARAGPIGLLAVVAGIQVALIAGWLMATAPPSPRAVAAVAIGTAVAADAVAAALKPASLTALAGVLGLSVLATVVVQLARGVARARVTEAMGSTLGLSTAVASVAAIVFLRRLHGGLEAVTAVAVAGGVGLLTARLVDFVAPVPHLATGVPHGGLGLGLGAITGTAAGALFAAVPSATPYGSALFSGGVAVVAVLADLAAAFAAAPAGSSGADRPRLSIAAGPLIALVATVPVGYLLALLLVA